jgi:multiple sugar transport system permease protein/putative aldouronate transport system permease protein
VKTSASDKAVGIVSWIFMGMFCVFCLAPFLLVISSSITDETTLTQFGYNLLPRKVSFFAYQILFKTDKIFNAYKVTIFITAVGTLASMLVTAAVAYALSVKTLKYRNAIALFVYFTMLFNGGLVATYILITRYLHLNNTIWVYIIPALVSPWNMFLLRNFFNTIPESLAESAKIDGANDIYILFKIILPLAKPALASISLFYALAYWNEWFKALLYISKPNLVSLQYIIMTIMRDIDFMNQMAALMPNTQTTFTPPTVTVRMATAVVTIGPIIFLYPFVQKYFIKGMMVGSVKG